MGDFREQLERARHHLEVDWPAGRAQAVERGMMRLRRRRRVTRTAGGVALLVVAAAGGWYRYHPASTGGQVVVAQSDGSVHFADGSLGLPVGPESTLRVVAAAAGQNEVELVHGRAKFRVAHRPNRVFRVRAGEVTVEVLGTEFQVERLGDGVRVTVEHGRVRVLVGGAESILTDGQGATFPERGDRPSPAKPSEEIPDLWVPIADLAALPAPRASAEKPARGEQRSWRALAEQGRFDQAYDQLRRNAEPVKDVAADLLLAADVARLSHHPAEATEPLGKVIRDHAGDPRAPLAAFTLGRVLLDELGEPKEAARAFAEAQRLAPTGPLAEDALAREVEAWSRGGETSLAKERAKRYVERYPQGSRMHSVRRFGALE